eukprot:683225-Pyramimonas_sp.AAC.1
MAPTMVQDRGRRAKIASDTRQGGLKTAPRWVQVSSEASKDSQEAKSLQGPKENRCCWPSRSFAPDGPL